MYEIGGGSDDLNAKRIQTLFIQIDERILAKIAIDHAMKQKIAEIKHSDDHFCTIDFLLPILYICVRECAKRI